MGIGWPQIQHKKNAKSLLELAPKKTPGQSAPPPDLNATALYNALTVVASYIAKKGKNLTVIGIGGAVNTIFLKTRVATHDVDFFNNSLAPSDYALLHAGAKEACKVIKAPMLQEDWFNNHAIFFIPQDLRQTLTNEAITQNEVIFKQPGLTVLAAPWHYAFCCKINRLAGTLGSGITTTQPYDLPDAVAYIRRYMEIRRLPSVQLREIKEWFARFNMRWNANVETVIGLIKAQRVPIV